MKHPSHPLFVHFPLAFWMTASVCDLAGFYYSPAWQFGSWCLLLGCVSALAAVASGLAQLLTLKPSAPIQKLLKWHIAAVSTSYSLYVVSLALRMDQGQLQQPGTLAVILSALAACSLLAAGWLGGQMVYGHGVGVNQR